MKTNKTNLFEEILQDPKFVAIKEKLKEEERKKVENLVSNFVGSFLIPLEELIEKAKDPEVKKEIENILSTEKRGNSDGRSE